MKEVTVYELYKDEKLLEELKDSEIVLEGWVRTNRDNGSLGFIELNDGSFFKNLQLVYDNNTKLWNSSWVNINIEEDLIINNEIISELSPIISSEELDIFDTYN